MTRNGWNLVGILVPLKERVSERNFWKAFVKMLLRSFKTLTIIIPEQIFHINPGGIIERIPGSMPVKVLADMSTRLPRKNPETNKQTNAKISRIGRISKRKSGNIFRNNFGMIPWKFL